MAREAYLRSAAESSGRNVCYNELRITVQEAKWPATIFAHFASTRIVRLYSFDYQAMQCDSIPSISHSICRQPLNYCCHLLVRIDPEALLLGYTCQLYIL